MDEAPYGEVTNNRNLTNKTYTLNPSDFLTFESAVEGLNLKKTKQQAARKNQSVLYASSKGVR